MMDDKVKVKCQQCQKVIVEHSKDFEFLGVEVCKECFQDYVRTMLKPEKLDIYAE